VSAAPQHPLTMERVLLMEVNGIAEHAYSSHSVLSPCQVFKLPHGGRMMQHQEPYGGTWETQTQLPAVSHSGPGHEPGSGLDSAS